MPRQSASDHATDSSGLVIVASPYHLCTREPAIYGAFMLGSAVVTLLPVPRFGCDGSETAHSAEELRESIERAPQLLRVLESWRWTRELWRAGIIRSAWAGREPESTLRSQLAEVAAMPAESRGPLRKGLTDNEGAFLDGLCADLLKAGPDPAFCIPVASSLDAFAARHGLLAVRGPTGSLSQRLERKLGDRIASFSMPAPLDVSGRVVHLLRAKLTDALDELRHAIITICGTTSAASRIEVLQEAAQRFAASFEAAAQPFRERDDDEGHRFRDGYLAIDIVRIPCDAVMRSSFAAIGRRGSAPLHDEAAHQTLLSLAIREMTVQPVQGAKTVPAGARP